MTELSPTARSCGLAGPSVGRSRSSRSGTLACCVTGPWRHWPSAVRAVGCRSFSLPFPDLSLYCHCLATALSLPLPFPDLSLYCHCLATALSLPLPFPDLSLYRHCLATALSLPQPFLDLPLLRLLRLLDLLPRLRNLAAARSV